MPIYILNAGIDGLQYHIGLKGKENQKLNEILSFRFESFIGNQLNYYSRKGKYHVVKELSYNKEQNKSSDWILYDDKCIIFLDCKLKKLQISSILETKLCKEDLEAVLKSKNFGNRKTIESLIQEQTSSLIKDIIRLGVDMGKILCCYCDWKAGKMKELPEYDSKMVFNGIILTLEETYCGSLELKDFIDKIAYTYVEEKKGIKLDKP